MLALSVRVGERVKVGENVWVTLVRMQPGQARLAFEAPLEVKILRESVIEKNRRGPAGDAGSQ